VSTVLQAASTASWSVRSANATTSRMATCPV
jgi:hypothetical protein